MNCKEIVGKDQFKKQDPMILILNSSIFLDFNLIPFFQKNKDKNILGLIVIETERGMRTFGKY